MIADYRDNKTPTVVSPSPLWEQVDIDESLWNQYRPYQLLLVEATTTYDTSGKPLTSYAPMGFLRFTLPIPPQDLTIDMPIMTNVQATLGGISETHGGAPFKDISLVGTTGVTPHRGKTTVGSDATSTALQSIFAGTTQVLNRVATSALQVAQNAPSPNINLPVPAGDGTHPNQIPIKSTGYYQYLLLQEFLENYVQIKSKNQPNQWGVDSRNIRLAFAIWKEKSVYLVSGVRFSRRKTASDPHLTTFTLQLKAWARINLNNGLDGGFNAHQFVARSPNLLAQAFNRFRAARDVLDASKDIVRAVVGDAVTPMAEALRESVLFMKAGTGAFQTMNDLPNTIQNESLPLLVSNWDKLRKSFEGKISPELDESLRNDQASGKVSRNTQKDPELSKIMDGLRPNSLQLRAEVLRQINAETARVRNFGRIDFERLRDQLRSVADQFAYVVGAGDATYAVTYGVAASSTATRSPTRAEYDVLFALNEAAIVLDSLAASNEIDVNKPTSLEYVAGLAEKSGIAFKVPLSKFAVPFPYGSTLERLAAQYLGNANRWHEIATLNGLRAPYVDEEGFSLPFLANGNGNSVVIGSAAQLFLGQPVWLSADGVNRVKRHILEIRKTGDGMYLLALDGDLTLHSFTTAKHAELEAFLPGTVNSQQVIYIPSSNEAGQDPEVKAIPGVDAFDPYIDIGGVDLLLTPSGDLAVTPDGDCRLSYGLTNIVQTVKLALGTPQGALLQHPTYGLNVPVGSSLADLSAQDLLQTVRSYFNGDPSFSGVRSASVSVDGPVVSITVEVGLAGVNRYLPITVQIVR